MTMANRSVNVREAWKKMFRKVFFEIMMAMIKAEPNEADYAQFREAARRLTVSQLETVAEEASEYYVSHANPSPGKLSKNEVQTLKLKAIAHALE